MVHLNLNIIKGLLPFFQLCGIIQLFIRQLLFFLSLRHLVFFIRKAIRFHIVSFRIFNISRTQSLSRGANDNWLFGLLNSLPYRRLELTLLNRRYSHRARINWRINELQPLLQLLSICSFLLHQWKVLILIPSLFDLHRLGLLLNRRFWSVETTGNAISGGC